MKEEKKKEKEVGYYKTKLEQKLQTLKEELATVGIKNADNPSDWELKPGEIDIMDADLNESADRIETQQENQGVLDDLEVQYQNVLRALKKIEAGTFGMCEVCGEAIEEDRLDVAPSARTCKKHREEEGGLAL